MSIHFSVCLHIMCMVVHGFENGKFRLISTILFEGEGVPFTKREVKIEKVP